MKDVIIIMYVDIIILIINIYLLYFAKKDFIYKSIDQFFINVNIQSFYQISDYLNRKYLKANKISDSSTIYKKNISLNFIQLNNDPLVNNLSFIMNYN
jgi:hypothetical protein